MPRSRLVSCCSCVGTQGEERWKESWCVLCRAALDGTPDTGPTVPGAWCSQGLVPASQPHPWEPTAKGQCRGPPRQPWLSIKPRLGQDGGTVLLTVCVVPCSSPAPLLPWPACPTVTEQCSPTLQLSPGSPQMQRFKSGSGYCCSNGHARSALWETVQWPTLAGRLLNPGCLSAWPSLCVLGPLLKRGETGVSCMLFPGGA